MSHSHKCCTVVSKNQKNIRKNLHKLILYFSILSGFILPYPRYNWLSPVILENDKCKSGYGTFILTIYLSRLIKRSVLNLTGISSKQSLFKFSMHIKVTNLHNETLWKVYKFTIILLSHKVNLKSKFLWIRYITWYILLLLVW